MTNFGNEREVKDAVDEDTRNYVESYCMSAEEEEPSGMSYRRQIVRIFRKRTVCRKTGEN